MNFRTFVDIPPSIWTIEPCERMLFVGSCFADNMGKRFLAEKFRAVVNPHGVMYNPASVLHTVQRLTENNALPFRADEQGTAILTFGTNHIYILKESGEIVDNCEKRPQSMFEERELSVDECTDYILQTVQLIRSRYPKVRFILTVSPIRYRKYGYHGSRLSKATLLLAVEKAIKLSLSSTLSYFPAYEILNDELRDYRFYKEDMLHPSDQAVEYIYERMAETFFSPRTFAFLKAWKPIHEALAHKPFNPESEEYKTFLARTKEKAEALRQQYPGLKL